MPDGAQARARIEKRGPGVVAGMRVAQAVFERVDQSSCSWRTARRESGARLGDREIAGPAASILRCERVALNFLGRLSGVATLTARYVRAVEGTEPVSSNAQDNTRVARAREAAVRVGGGEGHRGGLYDGSL